MRRPFRRTNQDPRPEGAVFGPLPEATTTPAEPVGGASNDSAPAGTTTPAGPAGTPGTDDATDRGGIPAPAEPADTGRTDTATPAVTGTGAESARGPAAGGPLTDRSSHEPRASEPRASEPRAPEPRTPEPHTETERQPHPEGDVLMRETAHAPATEDTAVGTVGFLYPGYSAEDDVPRMEGLLNEAGGRVRLPLIHTDIGTDAHEVDALLEMGSVHRLVPGAGELREQGAQAVMWACTSASFVFGFDGAHQQVRELAEVAGLPASSTSFAFAHAAQAIGAGRVAVAATYPEDVALLFAEFLQASDISVTGVRSAGIITAAEVGTWGYDEVLALARAGDDPTADAVLLPDTAMHTAAWVTKLEEELAKPVLTAHQVTAWEGLGLIGRAVDCPALGTLFTTHH